MKKKLYYIELINNKIIGKLECSNTTEVPNNFIQVTEDEYKKIKLPIKLSTECNNEDIDIQNILLLQNLIPTDEEIQKARNTIEILTLIQEVM